MKGHVTSVASVHRHDAGFKLLSAGSCAALLILSPEIMPQWISHNHGGPFGRNMSVLGVCECVYLVLLTYCVHSGINVPSLVEILSI